MKALLLPSYLGSGFGHIGRCLALAGELRARGWQCHFAVAGPHAEKVRRTGYHVYEPRRPFRPKPKTKNGPAYTILSDMNYQLVRDRFDSPRVVRASVREALRLVKHLQPDVLIGDTWPLTHIIGRQSGIPVVQITKSIVHPACPRLIWWEETPPVVVSPDVRDVFNPVLRDWGLPPIERAEDLLAGDLLLIPSIPELDPVQAGFPSTRYVGALIRSDPLSSEWKVWLERLGRGRPLVYVTLGGGADPVSGLDLFSVVVQALGDFAANIVISTGAKFNPADLATPPENMIMKKWVPGPAMIARSDLVISHGGYGTMMESVLHGVPSVIIPFHSEQEANGRRLEASGVGIVLRHSDGPYELVRMPWRRGTFTMLVAALPTLTPARLRDAVERILNEEQFRCNADRLKQDLAKYGGPSLAADLVEELVQRW